MLKPLPAALTLLNTAQHCLTLNFFLARRRVRARGLQELLARSKPCRPGTLTGRVFRPGEGSDFRPRFMDSGSGGTFSKCSGTFQKTPFHLGKYGLWNTGTLFSRSRRGRGGCVPFLLLLLLLLILLLIVIVITRSSGFFTYNHLQSLTTPYNTPSPPGHIRSHTVTYGQVRWRFSFHQ